MSSEEREYSYTEEGVDVTLILWMLSLSPSERLDVLEGFVNSVAEIRHDQASV